MTLHNHRIERSCEFLGESSLCYLNKFCDHNDGGDIMILICHVSSREHMFKGLYESMGGNHAMFGGYWSSAREDIKYLICHVATQNHVTEGSSSLMSGSSS